MAVARARLRFPAALICVALLLPALVVWICLSRRTHEVPPEVRCASNLYRIYARALQHARETGSFPAAGPVNAGAPATLVDFVARAVADGIPGLPFHCPCDQASTVEGAEGAGSAFDLRQSSYAWAAHPLKPDGPPLPLASDKYVDGFIDAAGEHRGHRRGMNVLYTGGSIQFLEESELPADAMLPAGLAR